MGDALQFWLEEILSTYKDVYLVTMKRFWLGCSSLWTPALRSPSPGGRLCAEHRTSRIPAPCLTLSPVQPRAWWREAADADLQQLSCFLPVVGGRTGRWCRVLVIQCHVSLDIVTDSLCLVHMSPAC